MHSGKDLKKSIKALISSTAASRDLCKPEFYRIKDKDESAALAALISERPHLQVFDTIQNQLQDLIKGLNPTTILSQAVLNEKIEDHLNGTDLHEYGVWVYYPWLDKLVHILDEKEYILVRTNRNKHKITQEEQDLLSKKKIGVIGLSVGQSVSLTLAIERGCGELRIADYDVLDLTNLNRIRSGAQNVELKKTVIVAREIAEIDPFLKVTCFDEGITHSNIDDFLTGSGKLDLLIDECDGIDIKILCRVKAKEYHIPVLMEASDRGTIDIERFDLEHDRPILHGYIQHLDISKVKDLKTSEEKLPYMVPITGLETLSPRMKASAIEIMQTITTWPQLASAVTFGGGITADLSRKILLDLLHVSGRFFIDIDELIADPEEKERPVKTTTKPITVSEMEQMAKKIKAPELAIHMEESILELLISAANLAPSGGNSQPWKWYYSERLLHLFFDKSASDAFLDYNNTSSYISLGAAIENLLLTAQTNGLEIDWAYATLGFPVHIASFSFKRAGNDTISVLEAELAAQIKNRHTNRKKSLRTSMSEQETDYLSSVIMDIKGADVQWLFEETLQARIGEVVAETDLIRFFNDEAHDDFVHKEMRWSDEEVMQKRDGIGVHTLDLGMNDLIGLRLLKDARATNFLKKIDGGKVFKKVSANQLRTASAVGLVTMPGALETDFLEGGRAIERLWLAAGKLGYQLHPLCVPLSFFYRNIHGGGAGLETSEMMKLDELRKTFTSIFNTGNQNAEIFLFRLFKASDSELRSIRKPVKDTFSVGK
ncbi:Rv1355c family protein [Pedobacter ginsengisoli]|uniref:Rv1355c family protein n=1 Tax=Pedobacter ginsengisoli TaxID=363852 RepID=UPI00254A980C|nr:Rv1355c family protein [Pedobacter ginsengisoli]